VEQDAGIREKDTRLRERKEGGLRARRNSKEYLLRHETRGEQGIRKSYSRKCVYEGQEFSSLPPERGKGKIYNHSVGALRGTVCKAIAGRRKEKKSRGGSRLIKEREEETG